MAKTRNAPPKDRLVRMPAPAIDMRLLAAVALLLVLATLAVYIRTAGNDFVNYDDNGYVTNNRMVMKGLSWETAKWAFTTYDASNWHPLTWLSYLLDFRMYGLKATGYHMVNVGFHIANTLLILGLLCMTTRRLWPSAFVAALFALHPLHVESAAWISERKDVLSTFFWLWTMYAWAYYTRKPGSWRYTLVVLMFAMGLMAKPMLVTLPLVLILMDYWPLERFGIERQGTVLRITGTSLKRIILEKAPLLVLALGSSAVTLVAQRKAMPVWEMMDLPMRTTNAVVSYGRYIREMFWPAGLAAFYPHPHRAMYAEAAAVLVLLLAVTIAVVYWGRQRKYLAFGWLWYIVTLVPVIGLVQVGDQSHADRYTYVSLIGLFLMLTWLIADTVEVRQRLKTPVAVGAVVVLAVLALLSWRQVGFWKNDISLFGRAADVTEGNYVMLANLGVAYSQTAELDRAYDALQRSRAIRPDEGRTINGIGSVLMRKNQYQQALAYFQKATVLQPELKEAHLSAGKALMSLRRFDEAEAYCRRAIELDPYWAEAYASLATSLAETGRIDEGIAECSKALKLDPRLAMGHFSLAGLYVKKEDWQKAADEYRKAIAIEPDFSAWNNLGNSLLNLGKLEEAVESYRESIKRNPNRADPHFNMGIALERLDRRTEAIEAVRKALMIAPDSADMRKYLDDLMAQPNPASK